MKNIIILACLFVLTACETTSDSGLWTGTGTYSDDSGRNYTCEYVRADISRNERSLDINRVTSDCQPKYLSWGPESFDIYGETIHKNGLYIGWAKADGSARFELTDASSGSRVIVSWNREGDFLNYSEEVLGSRHRYTIRAVLRRSY